MGMRFSWLKMRWVLMAMIAILLTQASLLVWSAKIHSPTWDEPGHLVAGISHWKFGRFDLYSVNPPVVRTIAAAPVYFFMEPVVDWSLYSTNPAFRSEVNLGRAWAEDNGSRIYDMIFVARLATLPIALLGTALCFLFVRELFQSKPAGVVAAMLWAFSPDVLAYGSVITPDLANAVAGLGCAYVFWKFLEYRNIQWSLALGVVTALAMLCKSTWLMLPILYAFILLIAWIVPGFKPVLNGSGVYFPRLVSGSLLTASCLIAFFFVNTFYGFNGSFQRLGDYKFVSRTFVGEPLPQLSSVPLSKDDLAAFESTPALKLTLAGNKLVSQSSTAACPACEAATSAKAADSAGPFSTVCESCKLPSGLGNTVETRIPDVLPGNRFAGSALAALPVPLPARYLEGIDIQRRDFESGVFRPDWASYFAGEWKQGGWWYFYLSGIAFKTPIALLALFALGIIAFGVLQLTPSSRLGLLTLISIAGSILLLLSINTGLNRYLRYALPVLPLIIIVASAFVAKVSTSTSISTRSIGGAVLSLCLLATIGTSLWNAPHWLSYFNAFAGGSQNGHRWFADSNVDWGQDLKFVEAWIERHPDVKGNIHLAYFGGFSPGAVGLEYATPPAYVDGVSNNTFFDEASSGPLPGWYIISKNYLVGHPMPVPAQDGTLKHHRWEPYTYFQMFEPVDSIGSTMLVYHLGYHEVNDVRKSLGLIQIHGLGPDVLHTHSSPLPPAATENRSITQVSNEVF